MVIMTESWGVGVPTSVRDYCSLRLCCYSYMPFLPFLVFSHHILSLPQHPTSPLTPPPPPDPHHTMMSLTNLPRGNPFTWMLPGSHFLTSLLACLSLPSTVSPSSNPVVSPWLPHVTSINLLACPRQPLINAHLITCPLRASMPPPSPIPHGCYPWLVCRMISFLLIFLFFKFLPWLEHLH